MDPNANLREQLELSRKISANYDGKGACDFADAARLAELVVALNDWIAGGGFLPARWQKNR